MGSFEASAHSQAVKTDIAQHSLVAPA